MIRYIPVSGRFALDLSGILVGTATFFGYIAPIMGVTASIIAIVWYAIQIYYFIKNRKIS